MSTLSSALRDEGETAVAPCPDQAERSIEGATVATIEGLEAVAVHIRDIRKARKFDGDVLGLTELHFDRKAGRPVFAIPGTTTTLRMHVYDPEEGGR